MKTEEPQENEPKLIDPHIAHTSTVVLNHSGESTIATLSTHAAKGLFTHTGSDRYNLDDLTSSNEILLARLEDADRLENELPPRV